MSPLVKGRGLLLAETKRQNVPINIGRLRSFRKQNCQLFPFLLIMSKYYVNYIMSTIETKWKSSAILPRYRSLFASLSHIWNASLLRHPRLKKSYFPGSLAPFVQIVARFCAPFPPPNSKQCAKTLPFYVHLRPRRARVLAFLPFFPFLRSRSDAAAPAAIAAAAFSDCSGASPS